MIKALQLIFVTAMYTIGCFTTGKFVTQKVREHQINKHWRESVPVTEVPPAVLIYRSRKKKGFMNSVKTRFSHARDTVANFSRGLFNRKQETDHETV